MKGLFYRNFLMTLCQLQSYLAWNKMAMWLRITSCEECRVKKSFYTFGAMSPYAWPDLLMMQAVSTSGQFLYQTTRHNTPEDSHIRFIYLFICLPHNLKRRDTVISLIMF
jgi:hypothetical protein